MTTNQSLRTRTNITISRSFCSLLTTSLKISPPGNLRQQDFQVEWPFAEAQPMLSKYWQYLKFLTKIIIYRINTTSQTQLYKWFEAIRVHSCMPRTWIKQTGYVAGLTEASMCWGWQETCGFALMQYGNLVGLGCKVAGLGRGRGGGYGRGWGILQYYAKPCRPLRINSAHHEHLGNWSDNTVVKITLMFPHFHIIRYLHYISCRCDHSPCILHSSVSVSIKNYFECRNYSLILGNILQEILVWLTLPHILNTERILTSSKKTEH